MKGFNKSVGPNLRKIMKDKKITAKELAAKVGVSTTHLSYVLNSKRGAGFDLLVALSPARVKNTITRNVSY